MLRAERFADFNSISHNFYQISADWYGSITSIKPEYKLSVSSTELLFQARVNAPAWCNRSFEPGSFVEGLSEQDVAELFIRADDTFQYQEFNLSPTGAWWSCLFDAYRVRAPNGTDIPSGVKVESNIEETHWSASILIPLSSLRVPVNFSEKTHANVSFIIHKPTVHYYSVAKIEGEPDFHQADKFEKLVF